MRRSRPSWISLLTATCMGCAHAPVADRQPSNTSAAGNVEVAAQAYRDAVAIEAFVLGPPDAHGRRQPVCWASVGGQSNMTPKFIAADPRGGEYSMGLPRCSNDQVGSIKEVAARATESAYAGLPLALGAICAIDLTLTAAATAYINHATKQSRAEGKTPPWAGYASSGVGLGLAAGTIKDAKVVAGGGLISAVLTVCTLGGVAVGYWLVPAT